MEISKNILKKLVRKHLLEATAPAAPAPAGTPAPAAPAAAPAQPAKPATPPPPELAQALAAIKSMNPQSHAKIVAYLKTFGVQVQ